MFKICLLSLFLTCMVSNVFSEEITAVKEFESTLRVTSSNGVVYWVPIDTDNRYYQEVQKWVQSGGVIEPKEVETSDQIKARIFEEMERLHIRILALEREKGKVSAFPARVTAINNKISNIDTKIDQLRTQAY